jgi:hypothetical protein
MRSGQIQDAINYGVAPFALCRIVSSHIRTSHKRGDHIQDSIGAVFHSLPQRTATSRRDSVSPFKSKVAASQHGKVNPMKAMLAHSIEASIAKYQSHGGEKRANAAGMTETSAVV